jgi:hypothetical protein
MREICWVMKERRRFYGYITMKLGCRNNISLSFSGKCHRVFGRVGMMRSLAIHPCRAPVPAPLDVTYMGEL